MAIDFKNWAGIGPPTGGIPPGGLKIDGNGNFVSNATGAIVPNVWQSAGFGSIPTSTPLSTGSQQPKPAAPAQAAQPFQFGTAPTAALPGINSSGVNPYLNDPLMSSYYGMESPYYQPQQQDFYGDPELFRPPTVSGK